MLNFTFTETVTLVSFSFLFLSFFHSFFKFPSEELKYFNAILMLNFNYSYIMH